MSLTVTMLFGGKIVTALVIMSKFILSNGIVSHDAFKQLHRGTAFSLLEILIFLNKLRRLRVEPTDGHQIHNIHNSHLQTTWLMILTTIYIICLRY